MGRAAVQRKIGGCLYRYTSRKDSGRGGSENKGVPGIGTGSREGNKADYDYNALPSCNKLTIHLL